MSRVCWQPGTGAYGALARALRAALLVQALAVVPLAGGSRTRTTFKAKAKVHARESITQPMFLIMSSPAEQKVSYTLLQDPEVPATTILPLVDSGLGEPHGVAYDPVSSVLYVADPSEETILCYHIQVIKCATSDCKLEYMLVVDSVQMHVVYSVKSSWVAVDQTGSLYYSDEIKKSINRMDIMLLRKIHAGMIDTKHLDIAHGVQPAPVAAPGQMKMDAAMTPEHVALLESSILSLYEGSAEAGMATPAGVASDGVTVYWTSKEDGIAKGTVTGGLVEPQAKPEMNTIANETERSYGIVLAGPKILFTDQDHDLFCVSKYGGEVTMLTGDLHSPRGVAWDGHFTSFVADKGGDAIFSLPTGEAAENQPLQLIVSFHDPFGIALIKASDPSFAHLQGAAARCCGARLWSLAAALLAAGLARSSSCLP